MATIGSTKFGFFETHKQEFEEGELPSEEPLQGSTSPTAQENPPPRSPHKPRNKQIHANFGTNVQPSQTAPSPAPPTAPTRLKKNEGAAHLQAPFPRNYFRSSEICGGWQGGERSLQPTHESAPYPPHCMYGYGYPPLANFYAARDFDDIYEKRNSKNQVHEGMYSETHYHPYPPRFDCYGYPGVRAIADESGRTVEGFSTDSGWEKLPGRASLDFELRGDGSSEGGPSKYYNNKQNTKNKQREKKPKAAPADMKEIIECHRQFFKPRDWTRVVEILTELLAENNNGLKALSAFLDARQGRRKIKLALKIFEMLANLGLDEVMEQLIQQERARRALEAARDALKPLLRQLCRPLDFVT